MMALRRNSAPITAYSCIRSPHEVQPPICSAASRGILSPSKSADTNSAAFSQFMIAFLLPLRFHAKSFATLLALQRAATSPCRLESPKSPPAPHTIALPLPAARAATVVPRSAFRKRPELLQTVRPLAFRILPAQPQHLFRFVSFAS